MGSKRMSYNELLGAIDDAWHDLHHAASLSRWLPDFQNEYESDLFWSCLPDDVHEYINDLQDSIRDKWGFDLSLYSYGRQGATIAPRQWMAPTGGNSFGGFSWSGSGVSHTCYDLSDYNHARAVYQCLRYMADFWRATAKWYCQEVWPDMVEVNGWQELIDEHNGMTKRQTWVWVPA